MVSEITAWVKEIALVVLFATFLEFLLPVSSMQRFVRVIMGLFIMLAILNPVLDMIHSRWLPEKVMVFGMPTHNTVNIKRAVGQTEENRMQLVEELYKKDLARQIRALVLAVDGVADARIAVEIEATGTQPARRVKTVTVYLKPGLAKEERIVTPISIGQIAELEKRPEITPVMERKIRQTITELLGMNSNQITIQRLS